MLETVLMSSRYIYVKSYSVLGFKNSKCILKRKMWSFSAYLSALLLYDRGPNPNCDHLDHPMDKRPYASLDARQYSCHYFGQYVSVINCHPLMCWLDAFILLYVTLIFVCSCFAFA